MKVDNRINLGQLGNAGKQQPIEKKQEQTAEKSAPSAEKSSVSKLAQLIQKAKVHADNLDDIRADKIALAEQRLADNFYDRPEVRDELAAKLTEAIKDTSS